MSGPFEINQLPFNASLNPIQEGISCLPLSAEFLSIPSTLPLQKGKSSFPALRFRFCFVCFPGNRGIIEETEKFSCYPIPRSLGIFFFLFEFFYYVAHSVWLRCYWYAFSALLVQFDLFFIIFLFFPFFLFFSDIFITYVDDRSVLCPIGVSQLISVSLGCIESWEEEKKRKKNF